MAISVHDIVVGDVLHLEPGDITPADGLLIWAYSVRCDESSITGESEPIAKVTAEEALRHLEDIDPFIRSRPKVLEGRGGYLVTSAGVHSMHGKIRQGLEERMGETPLQQRLSALTRQITMLGWARGALAFLVRFLKIC